MIVDWVNYVQTHCDDLFQREIFNLRQYQNIREQLSKIQKPKIPRSIRGKIRKLKRDAALKLEQQAENDPSMIKDIDHEKMERYMNYMVQQYESKNLESKKYVSRLIKFLDEILFTDTRLSGIFYGSQMRGQSDMVDLAVNVSDNKQNLSEVEIISLTY